MLGDIRLGSGARRSGKGRCLGLECWLWFCSAWEARWGGATCAVLFQRSAKATPGKVCPSRRSMCPRLGCGRMFCCPTPGTAETAGLGGLPASRPMHDHLLSRPGAPGAGPAVLSLVTAYLPYKMTADWVTKTTEICPLPAWRPESESRRRQGGSLWRPFLPQLPVVAGNLSRPWACSHTTCLCLRVATWPPCVSVFYKDPCH